MTLPQKIWPGKFGTRSKLVVTRYRNESDENNISIKGAVWYKYKREDMPGGAAGYRNGSDENNMLIGMWSGARNHCVWSRGAVSEWFRRKQYLNRQYGVVQGSCVWSRGAVSESFRREQRVYGRIESSQELSGSGRRWVSESFRWINQNGNGSVGFNPTEDTILRARKL
ncbi:hypothetical protein B0H16DRAFT_1454995 [Mycena metata]|uniref:Uncharacterized protein n=1 Tax=Mycena metata TaxID=1033252 RepID=A0AAD7NIR0_9AGAR|nr:hypothetical protein B0H16DRAFT_1454995 [Mycena metata]